MRNVWLGLGIVLAVAACELRQENPAPAASNGVESSGTNGSGGGIGRLALHGQVVVAHPPGTQDAVEMVRREASARCPAGFEIRSLHTTAPQSVEFADRLLNYQAEVDCAPAAAGAGTR
ncbi:MAG: hypothetical protein WDO24_08560 [Pseudomonadota bacterium]